MYLIVLIISTSSLCIQGINGAAEMMSRRQLVEFNFQQLILCFKIYETVQKTSKFCKLLFPTEFTFYIQKPFGKSCWLFLLKNQVQHKREKKSSLSQPSTSELPPTNKIMVLFVRSLDRNVLVFSKIVLGKNCQNQQHYITLQTKSLQLYCVDSLNQEMTVMTLDLYTTLKSTKVHRSEMDTFCLSKNPSFPTRMHLCLKIRVIT